MADPLSISASIVALLQFTATVVQYLSNVNDASDSRKRLLSEVSSASGLLYLLNDLAERDKWAENWPATLRSLATSNGPLDQFRQALELLAKKLAPVAGLSKAGKVLAWPFEKGDVQFVLLTIERQKTLFILALQSDHIGLSQEIARSVSGLNTQVSAIGDGISHLSLEQTRQTSLLQEQHTKELLAWLSPMVSGNKQNDILRGFQEGTGQWLFETQEIKDWLIGASNVLWCPGMPGAGKTLLASSIIDHLERNFPQMEIGISYIYCDYKDQSQTVVNLLGSLIGRLLWRQSIIPEELELSYKTHTSKHTHPSVTEYAAILRNMVMGFSRVFIVVDGLDEVMEKDGTRDALMANLNDLSSNTQLLVTSRWIPSLEQEFCTASRLEVRANNDDIATYVQSQIDKRPRLRAHVRRDQNLRELIVEKMVESCKGMFLLARLHVDSLANTAHPKAVKLALNQLPATLNNTYDETMQRVEQQDMNDIRLAHQVLSWIVCSFRPLTVEELQHALATDHDNSDIDGDAIIDEGLMLSVCAGLVVVGEQSRTIRLVHYTAQEYFETARLSHFPNANCTITSTCLLYLSFDPVRQFCSSDAALEVKLQKYAFIDYAAKNWGLHAATCNEGVIQDSVVDFLSDTGKVSAAAQIMLLPEVCYQGYSQRVVRNMHGLHLATYFGLMASTKALLTTESVQPRDGDGRVPLHWAAKWGRLGVTQILLDTGTDPNARDNGKVTALHLAASNKHQEVLELLLDRQADVNARNDTGGTALHWAAIHGLNSILSILLQHGAQTELRTDSGDTPLHTATRNNDTEIVRLLTEHKADVESRDQAGWTPLHKAVLRSQEITKLLLESGAHCEAQGRQGSTPLHLAAKRGDGEIVRLLLDHGASTEAKDYRGRTALHYAAEKGDTNTILALLPVARLEWRDKFEATALHFAASSKRDDAQGGEVVQLLLGTGRLDVNAQDTDGRTALHCAAEVGHANISRTLLTHGGDSTMKDASGATALDVARETMQETVIQLLKPTGQSPLASQ